MQNHHNLIFFAIILALNCPADALFKRITKLKEYITKSKELEKGDDQVDSMKGDFYEVNRQIYTDNEKCVEEITLSWIKSGKQSVFKEKCSGKGGFISSYSSNDVLVLGSPDDIFCLFTNKENEYYYKGSDRKWKKCSFVPELEETDITSAKEIVKLEYLIYKLVKTPKKDLKSKKATEEGLEKGNSDSWSGPVYEIERSQTLDKENKLCVEEIKVVWFKDNVKKEFKPKCLEGGSLRPVIHGETLLIVGSPDDDFCVFSSDIREYFILENGIWKKGAIGKSTKDLKITDLGEIDNLRFRIFQWKNSRDKFKNNINNIYKDKLMEAPTPLSYKDIMEENSRREENVLRLEKMRIEEQRRRKEEREKIKKMIETEGWTDQVKKKIKEMRTRSQNAGKEIQEKSETEHQTSIELHKKLFTQLIQQNKEYEEEYENFHTRIRLEGKRFLDENKTFLRKGY